ncbi:MAG: type II toxin-antitoxin system HicB family antitoxin [Alphaproteobacteria bacterium]|nr:type II toxin-antitoxin system HicB family antitoxin [Alphaproteobacteria bacterium]
MWTYAIKLTKDENRTFLVTVPALPEVTTFGRTGPEARRRARDAIEEAVAARMAGREDVPVATSGRITITMPTQAAAKIMLYRAMREREVSKIELARRLKWHRPQVDRLLNLRHGTRLDAMEKAFGALSMSIKIDVERAA